MPKHFKAIAAMGRNRVIGRENKLPWHLPEELKWFKRMTQHQVVIMGRKTFESLGKPLPNRETIVISRSGFAFPGVRVVPSAGHIAGAGDPREFFIIGGAQIFAETLPLCSDLYLTTVNLEPEGDVFFPEFENLFEPREMILQTPEFTIQRHQNKHLA